MHEGVESVRLGLRDDELAEVELGALLHDVGKLEVPEAILRKPSSLDEVEWHVMRRHAESGERLLDAADLPSRFNARLTPRARGVDGRA